MKQKFVWLQIAKDDFKFAAGHFIIFDAQNAERLHGHNYYVKVRLECVLGEAHTGLVQDFRVFKNLKYRPYADALQISSRAGPIRFITQDYVDKAHSRGLKVHGWTVNHPEEMGRLISLGVDGIITDYPTTLLKLIR